MNLIIDEGNSFIKVAFFSGNQRLFFQQFEKEDFECKLLKINHLAKTKACMIASVVEGAVERFSFLKKIIKKVVFLSGETPVPFVNKYATPKTLGIDRIALMAAASMQFPNQNVLVIDAGTCITFDILTEKNEYLGGAISPGIEMRFKAMHQFTSKLPLISVDEAFNIENFIGNSTQSCMISGVLANICCEIDGVIDRYKAVFNNLTIILTGGSHFFLEKNIKNCNFANSFFLLEGLNAILTYEQK